MSAVVKLASKMPGDFEMNGLDALAEDLIHDGKQLRAAFVVFDVQKVTEDVDTGDQVPTVRVRRFEPLGKADEISQAIRDTYTAAVEQRTGRVALPLDIVEVVDQGTLDDEDDL